MNENKFKLYQATVLFSVLFSLVGFSYNVWRMEASEENEMVRTACFEMLINLSSLEQLIFVAHYDNDLENGNPRQGWVTVGLLNDMSTLTNVAIEQKSELLKQSWATHWVDLGEDQASVDHMVTSIDNVRAEIKILLKSLE